MNENVCVTNVTIRTGLWSKQSASDGGGRPQTAYLAALMHTGAAEVSCDGVPIAPLRAGDGKASNIALMGVHTNICILNRSFGIRQMTQLGFHVVLARDLTDAMYDPRTRPFVSHTRGTELVIEHIESRWCPSIMSGDLTRVTEDRNTSSGLSSAHPDRI
jgi:hypothetical protein